MHGGRDRVGALDGLRGVAVAAVLGYHVWPGGFRGGFLGVDMFFVLSGYLLTAVLLREFASTGINRAEYAARRVRRIMPGLVALLVALVIVVPLIAPDDTHRLPGDIFSSLFGVANWHLISDGSSYFAQAGRPSFVRHLWSVGVEMQFYVLCPFLVGWIAGRRRRLAVAALVAGIAASAGRMAVLYSSPDPSRAYFGTDARLHALLVGCLTAVLLQRTAPSAAACDNVTPPRVVALAPAAVLIALVFTGSETARGMYPVGFLGVEVATALLITLALRPGVVASVLTRPGLRWVGERSYGIYLWHWPIVVLVRPGTSGDWPVIPAALAVLLGGVTLGALSYRFIERPLLHRNASGHDGIGHPVARRVGVLVAVLAVISLVQVPSTSPLEKVIAAGDKVIAAQTLPTMTLTSSTTVPAPIRLAVTPIAAPQSAGRAVPVVQAARPPAPTVNAPPPGTVPVTAVGDSVMVSAAGELHERLGDSGYIDAKQNRRFGEAAAILSRLRAQGALGRVVVIHLGNNGPVSAADVDAAMRETDGVQAVLLVTVRVDRSWQDGVNQALRDAATRWSTVRIVDWHAASNGHANWFQSDGTHFRTSSGPGANAYADLIASSIPPPPPPPSTTTTATTTPTTTTVPSTTTTTAADLPDPTVVPNE